jgi:hypothetical protein
VISFKLGQGWDIPTFATHFSFFSCWPFRHSFLYGHHLILLTLLATAPPQIPHWPLLILAHHWHFARSCCADGVVPGFAELFLLTNRTLFWFDTTIVVTQVKPKTPLRCQPNLRRLWLIIWAAIRFRLNVLFLNGWKFSDGLIQCLNPLVGWLLYFFLN